MSELFPKPPLIKDWSDIKGSFRLIEGWLNKIYEQLKNSNITSSDFDNLFYQSIGISSTAVIPEINTIDDVEKLIQSISINGQEIRDIINRLNDVEKMFYMQSEKANELDDIKKLAEDAIKLQIAEVN